MPSSLSSPSVTEHSHSQPPSPSLHDNQSSALSNATTQAAQDSDSEEEYTAALYRPVTQPGLGHSCNGKVTISLPLSLPLFVKQEKREGCEFPVKTTGVNCMQTLWKFLLEYVTCNQWCSTSRWIRGGLTCFFYKTAVDLVLCSKTNFARSKSYSAENVQFWFDWTLIEIHQV